MYVKFLAISISLNQILMNFVTFFALLSFKNNVEKFYSKTSMKPMFS